ncbi:MAG: PEP-CTERM sorting domain-containing protein, partial [Verrucomicrobiota bacterium]|nr:PEP-CTERM sorting domain-containing protein [Verrucomicrobiota bacterium]
PALGNLLLDVKNFERGPFVTTFDAHNVLGDSVSRVSSIDLNATSGGLDTGGLVTQFTVVPEPSTAFFGMMLVLFTAGSRNRRVAYGSRE